MVVADGAEWVESSPSLTPPAPRVDSPWHRRCNQLAYGLPRLGVARTLTCVQAPRGTGWTFFYRFVGEVGAERTLAMLRSLAGGESDPQDPLVREQSAVEERALRQVMQLSPETVYLGPWLARALSEASEQGVDLTVRTGEFDAPGPQEAGLLGRIVLDHVSAQRPGASLTVGLFGRENDEVRLLIVGAGHVSVPPLPDSWTMRRQRLGEQELVEIVWLPRNALVAAPFSSSDLSPERRSERSIVLEI